MSFDAPSASPPSAPISEPVPPETPPDRDSEAALNGETPHDQARRLIGRALAQNLATALDVLALRVRQNYARTLTDAEREAALVWLDERFKAARAGFRDGAGIGEFAWPDDNGGA